MGVESIINYPCVPKGTLGTDNILARLKARQRAETVIKIYRDQGDHRPLREIGFEVSRVSPEGVEHTETIIAADALAQAAELTPLESYCLDCPANSTLNPFGCIQTLNFPISEAAEIWLLKQLPASGSPLLHLLRRGIEEYGYDGETLRQLRQHSGIYFVSEEALGRPYPDDDLIITSDQIFEMLFLVGTIQPSHAAMLLLFLNAIPRDNLDPDRLFWLLNTDTPFDEAIPFLLTIGAADDASTQDLKQLLYALYLAQQLQVGVSIDI